MVSAVRSVPSSSAAARDDSGLAPTAATTTPPALRTARACTVPMKRTPTMPARTRAVTGPPGIGVAGAT